MVAQHPGNRLAAGLLALVLLAGLGIASYLVAHHENQVYGDATLALANCPESETVNCDLVNSSRWSEIAGVPIADPAGHADRARYVAMVEELLRAKGTTRAEIEKMLDDPMYFDV